MRIRPLSPSSVPRAWSSSSVSARNPGGSFGKVSSQTTSFAFLLLSTCIPLTASQGKSAVTTDDWLQATINDVKRDKRCRRLTVLVSREVDEISFDVHSCIEDSPLRRLGRQPPAPDQRLLHFRQ